MKPSSFQFSGVLCTQSEKPCTRRLSRFLRSSMLRRIESAELWNKNVSANVKDEMRGDGWMDVQA